MNGIGNGVTEALSNEETSDEETFYNSDDTD